MTDIMHFAGLAIVATVVLRHHHVVKHGPELLAIHPKPDLRAG